MNYPSQLINTNQSYEALALRLKLILVMNISFLTVFQLLEKLITSILMIKISLSISMTLKLALFLTVTSGILKSLSISITSSYSFTACYLNSPSFTMTILFAQWICSLLSQIDVRLLIIQMASSIGLLWPKKISQKTVWILRILLKPSTIKLLPWISCAPTRHLISQTPPTLPWPTLRISAINSLIFTKTVDFINLYVIILKQRWETVATGLVLTLFQGESCLKNLPKEGGECTLNFGKHEKNSHLQKTTTHNTNINFFI